MRLPVLLCALLLGPVTVNSIPENGLFGPAGNAACPCIAENPYNASTRGYPQSYGISCAKHDYGVGKDCSAAAPPAWCSRPWCYVSTFNCSLENTRTVYFAPDDLFYSYATCGSVNTFGMLDEVEKLKVPSQPFAPSFLTNAFRILTGRNLEDCIYGEHRWIQRCIQEGRWDPLRPTS